MLIAQIFATVNVESWQLVTGGVGLAAMWGLKYLQAFYDQRKEREIARDALTAQRDVANSNNRICELLQNQIGKIETVVAVNQAHHDQMIKTLETNCWYRNNQ